MEHMTTVGNNAGGDCAFFSVDQHRRNTDTSDMDHVFKMRKDLEEFLLTHRHDPSGKAELTWEEYLMVDEDEQDFEARVSLVSQMGTYVGLPELHALATMYDLRIVVVTPDGTVLGRLGDPCTTSVAILQFEDSHYELLRDDEVEMMHVEDVFCVLKRERSEEPFVADLERLDDEQLVATLIHPNDASGQVQVCLKIVHWKNGAAQKIPTMRGVSWNRSNDLWHEVFSTLRVHLHGGSVRLFVQQSRQYQQVCEEAVNVESVCSGPVLTMLASVE